MGASAPFSFVRKVRSRRSARPWESDWVGYRLQLTGYRLQPALSSLLVLGLLVFGLGQRFKVGPTDQLFLRRGGVVQDDNINIIERSELLLDNSDSVFALDADSLSLFEVHGPRLGS